MGGDHSLDTQRVDLLGCICKESRNASGTYRADVFRVKRRCASPVLLDRLRSPDGQVDQPIASIHPGQTFKERLITKSCGSPDVLSVAFFPYQISLFSNHIPATAWRYDFLPKNAGESHRRRLHRTNASLALASVHSQS